MKPLFWIAVGWAALALIGIIAVKLGKFLDRKPPRPNYVLKPRPDRDTIPKHELQEYLEGQLYWLVEANRRISKHLASGPICAGAEEDAAANLRAIHVLRSVLEKFELDGRA